MPKNTNVLIVRHGEKPSSGDDLTIVGQARAQAYAVYLQNHKIAGRVLKLDYLFAAADTNDSRRSRLTLEPLSEVTKLKIDCEHRDHKEIVEDILNDAEYHGKNILVCWHHGDVLAMAADLGVESKKLNTQSHWPNRWPSEVFGWMLQICYDEHGEIDSENTMCLNLQLMHGDHGQHPPVFKI